MRNILILLFFSCSLYGQMDTVNMSVTDFGVPSKRGYPDFVHYEMRKVNNAFREIDTLLAPMHLFIYFGDSTVSDNYTTAWAHLTNATDSLFIQEELDGFTMVNDSIIVTYQGHYDMEASFTHDGDNLETVSIRFYNSTKAAGIPAAGANTMRASNNFMSTTVMGYAEVSAGDTIVLQYKGDANGSTVFKNGVVRITRLHD